MFGPLLGALVVIVPVGAIVSFWFQPPSDHWAHIAEHLLLLYVGNTAAVVGGVGVLAALIGTTTAWLVAHFDFPGKRFFRWALILPLALPAYISAFLYANLLDSAGPVQQVVRALGGFATAREYWFPQILSLPGVIAVLTVSLFPYVYLVTLPVFQWRARCYLDAGRLLGSRGWQRLLRIELPLARPAIMGGALLCMMEALADYGSVSYYGVRTFTVGIYRTWFSFGDLPAAARLCSCMLLGVFLLIVIERLSRRGRVAVGQHEAVASAPSRLQGAPAWLACTACALPVALGFAVPFASLTVWAVGEARILMQADYWAMLGRSLSLAFGVSLVCVGLAWVALFANRLVRSQGVTLLNQTMSMGYAIPGAVVSVGILVPLAAFDHGLAHWMESRLGWDPGLLLTGSVGALALAYLVRFLAVAAQPIDAAYERVPREVDEACLSLGRPPASLWFGVHRPLVTRSLVAACLLVGIDIMKELPTTLILRPFNFDTLATKAFELASEEQLGGASIYALTLGLIGLVPVFLLCRYLDRTDAPTVARNPKPAQVHPGRGGLGD